MLSTKFKMLLGLFCALLMIGGVSTASAQGCPSGARPGSICGSGSGLAVNSNACIGPFYSNGTSVELNGEVTSIMPPGEGAHWNIHWSPVIQPNTIKIFRTTALALTADIINNSTINPVTEQFNSSYFPGYFTACVFNYDTTVSIDYKISIGPGQF